MCVDLRFTRTGLMSGGTRLCLWAVLAFATMPPLAGASHPEATRRVRLVAEAAAGLAPVELEVPERLISHTMTPPPKYRNMLLHMSFFLPPHADGTTEAADFQMDRVKGESEQLASMGGTASPADQVRASLEQEVYLIIDLRLYDVRAVFDFRYKQIGLDESGSFERYVSAQNDSPSSPETYRPVRSPDVMITCPKLNLKVKCSMIYTLGDNVYVNAGIPRRLLPEWRRMKDLMDSIVVVRSPVRQP